MKNWERSAAIRAMAIDYNQQVTVPIRDMERDGQVVFAVTVYGLEPRDLVVIPGGSIPMFKAVERMGLDPNRYQAWIWDIPGKNNT